MQREDSLWVPRGLLSDTAEAPVGQKPVHGPVSAGPRKIVLPHDEISTMDKNVKNLVL